MLFGFDLATIVGEALSGQLTKGTLTRQVSTTRDPAKPSAGFTTTTLTVTCEGVIEDNRVISGVRNAEGYLDTRGLRVAYLPARLIADGLPPQVGNIVSLGTSGGVISAVQVDAAEALYSCELEQ